jgi:heterodisulfide reductase subunit D
MADADFWVGFDKQQALTLFACGKCAECTLECPVYDQTKDETLAPASRVRALRSLLKARYGLRALLFGPQKIDPDDIQRIVEPLYRGCTVCGRCMTVCPFHFDLINIWEKARENVVKSGFGPAPTVQVKEAVETEKNVYKMPSSSRRDWLEYEEVEPPNKDNAETVYFVGCTTSYSSLLMPIAHAVTSILEAAGEDWMMLPDEWCCGSPLKFAGQTERLRDFVLKNIRAIEATGAKQVVFNCPSCYRRFKEDYPKILGRKLPFALKHIVELANEHVKAGRLRPAQQLEETVTYHDPCELTRLLGVCEEPRELLAQYATRIVEMPETRMDGYCCGAGGLLKAIDAELSLSLSKKRVAQAEAAGAKILTSACPACKLNLDEAAMESESDLQVLDVTEVVAQQLGLLEP